MHCCQLFDRFDELELVVVHQEVDRVAVRATSKAVVKLFLTVNGEGRGFLVVEWTTRVEILALLFQLHTGIDQIDAHSFRKHGLTTTTRSDRRATLSGN